MRTVEELEVTADVPGFVHPEWSERLPWLVQGVTGRGADDDPFDMALFGERGGGDRVWSRWSALAGATGCPRIVHGAQVHGTAVRVHGPGPPGVGLSWAADGHVTADSGVLLTVAVADCVPVYLVHEQALAVCVLHAGWRGVAGGLLRRALGTLDDRLAIQPKELFFHAGPAICGTCYEVGPEVHEALGAARPSEPTPIDLRARLAEEAVASGIPESRITVSGRCTRCGPGEFFSHRGGDSGRQVGFVGIRGEASVP